MKKITMFFLAVFALTFIACGKEEGGLADKIKSLDKTEATSDSVDHGDKGEYLDIDRIVSEFDINEEDDEHIEFQDRDEEREVYRIFMYEKLFSVDFKDPKKIDSLEEGYLEQGCDIIYKDKDTIMIGIFDPEVGYGYNIHNFDSSKTTLGIMVAVGSIDELSKNDLLEILKEAKAFIK